MEPGEGKAAEVLGGEVRAALMRYRSAAVFLAVILPLTAGVALSGPLMKGRTLAASVIVREERAAGVLASVEGVRQQTLSMLLNLLPAGEERTVPVLRRVLSEVGWEVYPGVFTAGVEVPGVPRSFLDGALRDGTAVDFLFDGGEPRLLAGVAGSGRGAPLLLARRPAASLLVRALGADPQVGAGIYVEDRLVLSDPSPLGGLLPTGLDPELVTRVIGEERPLPLRPSSGDALLGAAVPLKDFDSWDVIAVVVVAAPRSGITGLAERPGAPLVILLLLAGIAAAAVAGWSAALPEGRMRAFALTGIVPALLGAVLYRSRLKDAVEQVLAGGPAPVERALAGGGLVERFTFGSELLLLGLLVLLIVWTSGLLLTAWNLDRPRTLRTTLTAYSFLSPSIAGLLLFFLGPMLFAFYISFHEWSIIDAAKPFVGLGNYSELLRDGDFLHALWITFLYTLHVPVSMALALGLALLLNRPLRGVGIFRTLFFLPSITSFVAIAMVWEWIYNPDFGLANWVLRLFGLAGSGWLTDPRTALPALMLMAVWIGLGYQMVIFLAGLQGIPHTLYEAAVIDGAGPVRRFFRITLPLLRPTTFFVLVTSIIGSFQVFTQVYIMTDGGPVRATDVVVYHIYSAAWDQFRMGSAAAMSWVLFAIILVATLLQFRLVGRETSLAR